MHFEPYSGPIGILAWGPNGACQPTGRFKHILGGSLAVLYSGANRVFLNTPLEILEKIQEAEREDEDYGA
jgi:hypothetical protein